MSFKKTVFALLLLSSVQSFGQKIEKVTAFSLSGYKKIPAGATAALPWALSLNSNTHQLKVYSAQLVPAEIVEIEDAPKKKGILTGWSVFSGSSGQNQNVSPALPILFEHTFDTDLNAVGQATEGGLYLNKLDKAKKYNFELTASNTGDFPKKIPLTISLTDLMAKDELFSQVNTPRITGYRMKTEGDGLIGTKNQRSFMYANVETVVPNVNEFIVKREIQPLSKEKAIEQLKEQVIANERVLEATEEGVYAALLAASIKNDNWDPYKLFQVVIFDKDGQIKAKTPITFEFLRALLYGGTVKDVEGKTKGFIYFFGAQVALGQKKQKDPVENRFNVVYLDTEGKIKARFDFTHGEEDSKRGLYPIFTLEKDGELRVLSLNYNKLLKPVVETIVFDNQSKKAVNKTFPASDIFNSTGIDIATISSPTMVKYENNKILVLTRNTSTVERTALDGTKYNAEALSGYSSIWLDDQLNILHASHQKTPSLVGQGILEPLTETPDSKQYLVTHGSSNGILTITSNASSYMVLNPKDCVRIESPLNKGRNYVIDSANHKIHLLYRTAKANEATLATVSF